MKGIIFLISIFILLFSIALSEPNNKPKRWALLIATTKDWIFYRHQSNICHAYQTLVANGFPKENIIVMMYDDIAYNIRNSEKGVIRNHPYGPNVYAGVKKDYTGTAVNREVFLAVLQGNKSAVENIGSGRVIESGPNDVILINIVGLGSYRFLHFPSGFPLYAGSFTAALESLRHHKKCKKMLLYVETTSGGSLFEGSLSRRNKILASVAAASAYEIPFAVYCNPSKRVCYGSLYGVAWMEHMDRMRQLRSGRRETLFNQFQYVRTQNFYSHVDLYGHLEMGHGPVSEFLGYKYEPKKQNNIDDEKITANNLDQEGEFDEMDENIDMSEIEMGDIEKDTNIHSDESMIKPISEIDAISYASEEMQADSTILLKNREFVDNVMNKIIAELSIGNDMISAESMNIQSPFIDELTSVCYENAIKSFNHFCLNLNENTYGLRHLYKFANLCKVGIHEIDIETAMKVVCNHDQQLVNSIH